jgi:hypothetical protein
MPIFDPVVLTIRFVCLEQSERAIPCMQPLVPVSVFCQSSDQKVHKMSFRSALRLRTVFGSVKRFGHGHHGPDMPPFARLRPPTKMVMWMQAFYFALVLRTVWLLFHILCRFRKKQSLSGTIPLLRRQQLILMLLMCRVLRFSATSWLRSVCSVVCWLLSRGLILPQEAPLLPVRLLSTTTITSTVWGLWRTPKRRSKGVGVCYIRSTSSTKSPCK